MSTNDTIVDADLADDSGETANTAGRGVADGRTGAAQVVGREDRNRRLPTFFMAFVFLLLAVVALEYAAPWLEYAWKSHKKREPPPDSFPGQLVIMNDDLRLGFPTRVYRSTPYVAPSPKFSIRPTLTMEDRLPVWLALIACVSAWVLATKFRPKFPSLAVYCLSLPVALLGCSLLSIQLLRPGWISILWRWL